MERGIRVSSVLGAIAILASAGFGADLHVPGTYGTIQAAIDAAGTGDRVIIAEGYYSGAGNRDLDFGGRAITVQSDNPEDWGVVAGTVIDCENIGRGFYFQSGETSTSVVAGLTIANGYADYGGGIRCVGSSPTIRNCIISDSSADDGGGMENEGSSAVITSCIFTGNSTTWGSGGGMCNYDCAGLEITNCIFYGNSAYWGGAIADGNSSPAIVNCTFTGNTADYGGGIANFFGANPSISNCILWGDSATTGPEIYGDCVVSYCDVQGSHPGTGNIDADPLFIDAAGGDYHLPWDSPCIDAGTNSPTGGLPVTDIEGIPRPLDGDADSVAVADMGAYEFNFAEPVIALSKTYFEFTAGLGGPNPEGQILSVSNGGAGTLNWQITEACEWLSAEPNSGSSSTGEGNEVALNVDISGLAAGSYYCELTLADPCALNSPRAVDVNLIVTAPIIEVSAQQFQFTALEDGLNPDDQILTIHNSGQGTLNWQITEGCEWLLAEPDSGSSMGEANEVTLSVDIVGLAGGSYNCMLLVSDANAANNPQIVDVNLVVGGPLIELSATYFEFRAESGGPNPASQMLTIHNGGGGTLNWQITEACGWLSVEPNSGSSTGEVNEVTLSADISGLGVGDYNCQLIISDANAENSPQTVAVDLTVSPAGWPVDPNGLISWWGFEEGEGTIASDPFGGNDGTIYGATWTSGMIGGALSFDGVDDYVNVGNDASLKPPLPVTLSAWIKLSGSGSTQYIIALDNQTSSSYYYGIWWYVQSANSVGISYGDGGHEAPNSRRSKAGTTVLDTDTWYHIAAVLRGPADMNLYVDGMDEGGTYSGSGGSLAYSSASSLIGMRHDSALPFGGRIDDVRVYERALSGEEMWEVYQAGFPEGPRIDVWPESLEFYAEEGGSNAATQTISIRNMGAGTLNWGITENCSWLEVDPNSGTSSGEANEIAVSVDISGLAGGSYYCELIISDTNALDSPQIVDVNLVIIGPTIELSSQWFRFISEPNGPDPNDQILYISNSGGGTLKWEIAYDCNWLSVEPNSGISTGEMDEVTLSVDVTGLPCGSYNCELIISDPNAANSPHVLATNLIICLQGPPHDPNGLVSLWQFEEGEGTTAYDSFGGNDGTIYDANWTSGIIGGALSLDGVDDYVDVGNNASLKPPLPVTLCAWVKLSSLGSPQYVMALDNQTSDYYGIWWYVGSAGNLAVCYGDGGDPGPDSRRSKGGTTELEADSWYHVAAIVRGPADMNLYVNGIDDGGTSSGSGGSLAYSSASSLIGMRHDSGHAFGGKIDDVRVYERDISTEEILEVYQGDLCREVSPSIHVWPKTLEFDVDEGGPNPASQTISIRNIGRGVLDWRITEDCSWLEVDPNSGSCSAGEANEVTLNVDISGLAWGEYGCEVIISDPNALNSPRTVDVNLHVYVTGELYVPSEYPTIQGAIDWAAEGATVVVAPGTYTGSGNKNLDFAGKAITVRSIDPNDPNVVGATVIDCESSGRGFHFHSGEGPNSIVSGLTISHGQILYSPGGGVYCENSSPTIEKCRILGCDTVWGTVARGGGIACQDSSPRIEGCLISGCAAYVGSGGSFGGGIWSSGSGRPIIMRCTIQNCTAEGQVSPHSNSPAGGGGIYCSSAVEIYDSVITGNVVLGGLQLVTQRECYPYNSYGGGICLYGSGIVQNCLVVNNHTELNCCSYVDGPTICNQSRGGGIYCSGSVEVKNCTVYGNDTDSWTHGGAAGGGIYGGAIVTNSIVWGNIATSTIAGGTVVSHSDVEGGWPGEGNIDADPCFSDGYHLGSGSPCIDAGDPNYVPAPGEVDIDGEPRVMGIRVDMGVDEFTDEVLIYPIIEVSPVEVEFYSTEGGLNPEAQTVLIRNIGGGLLNWEVTEDCNWLEVEPNNGTSAGEVDEVAVSAEILGLARGIYSCELTISDANAINNPQSVVVNLTIAGTLYVPSEYSTIQAAIDAADNGDTVIVEPGTYTGAGNKDLDFGSKAITVQSTDPEDPCVVAGTVIDCEDSGRGFYFHSGEDANSVLEGLTVTNGHAPNDGGAVYCSESSPTIRNCVITGNRAHDGRMFPNPRDGCHGGAIYCDNASPVIENCTITGNSSGRGYSCEWYCDGGEGGDGGGIFCSNGSSPLIKGCIIANNITGEGGDSYSEWSGGGGGEFYPAGPGGSGGDGGGIYCLNASVTIVNCLITGNKTGDGGSSGEPWNLSNGPGGDGGDGGGIYCEESASSIENCTIVGNQTGAGGSGADPYWGDGLPGDGGGVYSSTPYYDSNNPIISNCVVWNNEPEEIDTYHGHDLAVTYSDVNEGYLGEGNIDADPCFVTGPEGDYYLSQVAAGQAVNSPCVDAGSDTAENLGLDMLTTRTDQATDGGVVDMGYHYPVSVAADLDGDSDVDLVDYALFAADYAENSMTIPRGSVVVDGNLDDWTSGVEWVALDKIYYGSPNDVEEAWFALQWDGDANKVYAAVIVYDSDHVFSDEYVDWDASDRLEVYSQGDAEGGSGWTFVYDVAQHYMVGPNTLSGSWATWGQGEAIGPDAGFGYALAVSGDEIVYEIGVKQFDNYGGFSGGDTTETDINVGSVVAFDLVVSTRWSGGFGMLSENLMTGKFNDADKFARYMLVEEVGGPPCFERIGDLDSNCAVNWADLAILVESWLWEK